MENKRYEFRRLNNQTNHPFYISDVGYGQESNTLTFIGDGNHNTGITGSESFIVNLNNYPVDSSIHYYYTAHSGMRTQFYYAALIPTTIYVSGGSETAPYYQFYSDSAGINEVSVLYLSNVSYEFRRLNNVTSHPFYISDVGYGQESNTLTFIGDGNHNTGITGSESFIMVFNNYPVGSSIHYYCTAHSGMRTQFTYESEQSSNSNNNESTQSSESNDVIYLTPSTTLIYETIIEMGGVFDDTTLNLAKDYVETTFGISKDDLYKNHNETENDNLLKFTMELIGLGMAINDQQQNLEK